MDEQTSSTTNQRSLSVIELDTIIKRYLKQIQELRESIKEQRSMVSDVFERDAMYKENSEKAKEITRVKTARKQLLLKDPAAVTTKEKVLSLKDELKDAEEALSSYAQEYEKISGLRQIENDNGEILEIVHSVKLVKRSSKNSG